MASHKQIIANQRNALKSTGPRTGQGKAIVCQNAKTHGILSQEVLIDENESVSFDDFSSRIYHQLNPLGDFEKLIVDRIVTSAWRLRRIIRIETEFYRSESRITCSIKGTFLGNAADRMAMLSRYEAAIEKSLYKALNELIRLQAARQDSIDFTEIGFVSQKTEKMEINRYSIINPL